MYSVIQLESEFSTKRLLMSIVPNGNKGCFLLLVIGLMQSFIYNYDVYSTHFHLQPSKKQLIEKEMVTKSINITNKQ